MGLNIVIYKALNGLAEIKACYCKVRNIQTTKIYHDKTEIYTLTYNVIIEKDTQEVENKHYGNIQQATPILNGWKASYEHLKEELTKENLDFTDVL